MHRFKWDRSSDPVRGECVHCGVVKSYPFVGDRLVEMYQVSASTPLQRASIPCVKKSPKRSPKTAAKRGPGTDGNRSGTHADALDGIADAVEAWDPEEDPDGLDVLVADLRSLASQMRSHK